MGIIFFVVGLLMMLLVCPIIIAVMMRLFVFKNLNKRYLSVMCAVLYTSIMIMLSHHLLSGKQGFDDITRLVFIGTYVITIVLWVMLGRRLAYFGISLVDRRRNPVTEKGASGA